MPYRTTSHRIKSFTSEASIGDDLAVYVTILPQDSSAECSRNGIKSEKIFYINRTFFNFSPRPHFTIYKVCLSEIRTLYGWLGSKNTSSVLFNSPETVSIKLNAAYLFSSDKDLGITKDIFCSLE